MRKYEGLFVFPTEATGEGRRDPIAEVTKWIEKFQGKILQKNDLGKKILGHMVGKYREGRMFVFEYEMDPSRAQEFRKELELQEGLLKYMISIPEKKPVLPPVVPVAVPKAPTT
ncbi:MAG TPA: 30S ribosomal protein S6 [Candidatus Omnitrophota bacterium]|nr:30S ribosomal protein S6 [Candidatus Omnitrophota bacterium]HPS37118.1 30S ribosomal protein S6 [Candidatus Omnitrophota bacterium]